MSTRIKRLTPMIAAVVLAALPSASLAQGDDVQVHVFVSQGYAKSTSSNDVMKGTGDGTFNFNEFGFNLQKQVTPRLRIGMQLFAQARGDVGKDAPTIDWALGDYRLRDWTGIRFGKVKMPLGLYNESRDNDSLRTFIFLPQGTYDDGARESTIAQTGMAGYGTIPMKKAGRLGYQLHVGALAMVADGGVAKSIQMALPVDVTDAHGGTTYVANAEWQTPVEGLRVAVTRFQTAFRVEATTTALAPGIGLPAGVPLPVDFTKLTRSYVSCEYAFRNLVLAAEYRRQAVRATMGGVIPRNQDDESYYVSGTYRLNDIAEVGAYYEEYYLDRFNKAEAARSRKDLAAAVRFDVNKYWLVKAELHGLHGTALMIPTGADPLAGHSYVLALKTTFSF